MVNFPFRALQAAIMGHSMGGHGALTLGLRNPHLYKSISAFAPITNPIQVPWGQKAFSGYLGDNQEEWKQYDATELVSPAKNRSSQRQICIYAYMHQNRIHNHNPSHSLCVNPST